KCWLTALAILTGMGTPVAMAQTGYYPPQVNPNPTVSPYLNLIPNNPYVQYFGLGQNQMNNTRAVQQLQQQVSTQPNYLPVGVAAGGVQPNVIMTGHPVTFGNLSHYYPPPGYPFAGMGMGLGGGYGGQVPNVGLPLPQGYAQGGYYGNFR